ncbi:pilus assembly protein PilZ [Methylobacterium sp. NEAU 140]|uniref:pilus assembly protein PilZ n=1 Tax=Methylobacterium sp. NEAU 140 TaxID=3064945 RepID=UPI0027339307|nr:pilus assembly protein PilZ [Methylobacterium sp. NEAU 140]MDP4021858.1 pilus assembly protein PilZ [Methylobacterium sp. NEAU 140]
MLDDRRGAFRRNAFTFGAVTGIGPEIECLVWDATESGAQIEVADPDRVPDRFDLRLTVDAPARPVAVAWRRGRRLGLTFLG